MHGKIPFDRSILIHGLPLQWTLINDDSSSKEVHARKVPRRIIAAMGSGQQIV
jgi:hypothetical protein